MIRGRIRNREACIELEFSGPDQLSQPVKAVLDTGYNGYLTLPGHVVSALQLPFAGHRRGTLADGSVTRLDVFLGSIVWHGKRKDVLISQAGGAALIGMSLLFGSRVTMAVVADGELLIEELR